MNSSYRENGRLLPDHNQEFSPYMAAYEYMSARHMGMEQRPNESFTQMRMKQMVDEMRFKEKMEVINKKKGKYKRSTNNCHKKYIGIVKNLVCLKLSSDVKEVMLDRFFHFRNSRVYYFIMLSYLKWYLSPADIRWVLEHFIMEVSNKIQRYRMEINITSNSNFIHFRRDEIAEMQFAIDSIYNFLKGNEEDAMRILYQKNKYIIIKKNEYLKTLQIVRELKEELAEKFKDLDIEKKQLDLRIEEVYQWRQSPCHGMSECHMPPPPEREWHSQRYHDPYSRDMRVKDDRASEQEISQQEEDQSQFSIEQCPKEIQKTTLMVKQEQKVMMTMMPMMPMEKQYPLAGLENSYPIIDYMNWHNWLMQRQKTIEFQIKSKQELTGPPPAYGYQESFFYNKPQNEYYFNKP